MLFSMLIGDHHDQHWSDVIDVDGTKLKEEQNRRAKYLAAFTAVSVGAGLTFAAVDCSEDNDDCR